jgi:hypothetical protein
VTGLVESFIGHDKQFPGAVERVAFAAAMTGCFLLDAAADLVHSFVSEMLVIFVVLREW